MRERGPVEDARGAFHPTPVVNDRRIATIAGSAQCGHCRIGLTGGLPQVVDTIKRFHKRPFERVEQTFLSAHIKPEPRKKSSGDTATRRRVRLWKMEGAFYGITRTGQTGMSAPPSDVLFHMPDYLFLRCPSADRPSRYNAGYIPSAGMPADPEGNLPSGPAGAGG